MDSQTIGFMRAFELAELIRTKKIPRSTCRPVLRNAALELKVNAIAYIAADLAMDDRKRRKTLSSVISELAGLPATIKDFQITEDMPTQYGSKIGDQPLPFPTHPKRRGIFGIRAKAVPGFVATDLARTSLTDPDDLARTVGTLLDLPNHACVAYFP
ncbi:hypothetical protein NKI74_33520 [Mesorhizobium sp. M0494]|uniref:hypothetical protein n=1 Tax=Mesorhizobium sp. M0494 TaxID=2956951 RepID=UPI00333C20D6